MRTLPGLLALTLLTACTQEVGRPVQLRVVTDYSARTQACAALVGSLSYTSVPPAGGEMRTAVVSASARPGEVVEQQVQALFGPAQEFTASAVCQVWLNPDTHGAGLITASQVTVTRTVTEEDLARGLTLRVRPPTEIGERPGFVLKPFGPR